MGFLKFLFIAIAILTLLRMVVNRLLPWLLRRFARKMQERAFGAQHQNTNYQSSQKRSRRTQKQEGKINIDFIPPESETPPGAKSAGEFIDFEEIPNK